MIVTTTPAMSSVFTMAAYLVAPCAMSTAPAILRTDQGAKLLEFKL